MTRLTPEREKYYRDIADNGSYANMSSRNIEELLTEIDILRAECNYLPIQHDVIKQMTQEINTLRLDLDALLMEIKKTADLEEMHRTSICVEEMHKERLREVGK